MKSKKNEIILIIFYIFFFIYCILPIGISVLQVSLGEVLYAIAPKLLTTDTQIKIQQFIKSWLFNFNVHKAGDILTTLSLFLAVPTIIGKERLDNWDSKMKFWMANKGFGYIMKQVGNIINKILENGRWIVFLVIIPVFLIVVSKFWEGTHFSTGDAKSIGLIFFVIIIMAMVLFGYTAIGIGAIIGIFFIIFYLIGFLFPVLLMPYRIIIKLGAKDSLERTLLLLALITGTLAYWINK